MEQVALCEVSGLLSNLLANLAGKNGKEWAEILRRVVRRQEVFGLPRISFQPEFEVILNHRSDLAVLDEIERQFGLDRYVREHFFDKPDWFRGAPNRLEPIVITSGRAMGFSQDVVRLRHIYVRGEELGLELCRKGAPVWALLQNGERFRGRYVRFATEPYKGHILGVGEPNFTSVSQGGTSTSKIGLGLHMADGGISAEFSSDALWAFRMPSRR